jgi:hypothetical protein
MTMKVDREPTGKTTCYWCDKKIKKGTLRAGKSWDGEKTYYHYNCAVEKFKELLADLRKAKAHYTKRR